MCTLRVHARARTFVTAPTNSNARFTHVFFASGSSTCDEEETNVRTHDENRIRRASTWQLDLSILQFLLFNTIKDVKACMPHCLFEN